MRLPPVRTSAEVPVRGDTAERPVLSSVSWPKRALMVPPPLIAPLSRRTSALPRMVVVPV